MTDGGLSGPKFFRTSCSQISSLVRPTTCLGISRLIRDSLITAHMCHFTSFTHLTIYLITNLASLDAASPTSTQLCCGGDRNKLRDAPDIGCRPELFVDLGYHRPVSVDIHTRVMPDGAAGALMVQHFAPECAPGLHPFKTPAGRMFTV